MSFPTWNEKLMIALSVRGSEHQVLIWQSVASNHEKAVWKAEKYEFEGVSSIFPQGFILFYYSSAAWLSVYLVLANWKSLDCNKPFAVAS